MPTAAENSAAASAALVAALGTPLKVSGDMGSVEQRPAADMIAADRYLAAKAAAANPRRGIRFTKLIPGGTA